MLGIQDVIVQPTPAPIAPKRGRPPSKKIISSAVNITEPPPAQKTVKEPTGTNIKKLMKKFEK
jgi:hypothetical protein